MSTSQTYRVLVRKPELYSIDIAARSEAMAIARAEKLWHGGMQRRFDKIQDDEPEFEIDVVSTSHLADVANEDRAAWALKALRAFADVTGSDLGREALHDLLCDLGHYADQRGLDFREEVERATATWADEKIEGGAP